MIVGLRVFVKVNFNGLNEAKYKPIESNSIRRTILPAALSIQTSTLEKKHLDHYSGSDVEPIIVILTRSPSTPTHSIENHSNLNSPVAIPPTGF
ncbi:hypothetical protein DFH28DRAFT_971722 [Melampsora americana]|nr:hypothetical protein DFH28DRAFT_971722 [Melampsora americana]